MLEGGLDSGLRGLLMGHKNNSRPAYGDGGSMVYWRDEIAQDHASTGRIYGEVAPFGLNGNNSSQV